MNRRGLVIAAHGSNHEPAVNEFVRSVARDAGGALGFAEFAAAFHQGEPNFASVIDELSTDEILVVPLMTSEGYYSREILPRELRRNRRFAECRVHITPPVGTHEGMVELAFREANAIAVNAGLNPAALSLVMVGHGTPRNVKSRAATERLVKRLADRGAFGEVLAVFLDEDPRVESVPARARQADILVMPFLIGGGPHALQDIPERLRIEDSKQAGEWIQGRIGERRVICARPIGASRGMMDIVMEMAREGLKTMGPNIAREVPRLSSSSRTLRIGTRGSALALWQAGHVKGLLEAKGTAAELCVLSTSGDRDHSVAIADLASDSPFTDDIDAALLTGEIDLAVHSLKDLPVDLRRGLAIAAIPRRGSAEECLVSRDRAPFHALPPGAVVGTSSLRRRAQMLALRPDLRPVPLRGAVDERIRKVFDGEIDAAILALAGLERIGREDAIAQRFSLEEFLCAPGQGALAVVAREDDDAVLSRVSVLDHLPTRRAAQAELDAFRPFEHSRDHALAAHGEWRDDRLHLRARILSADGRRVWDAAFSGDEPGEVARGVLDRLALQGAPVPVEAPR